VVTPWRIVQPNPIHTVTPTSIRACYNQAWPAASSPLAVREPAKKAHAVGDVTGPGHQPKRRGMASWSRPD
jgi:hypothetical protein